MPIDTTNLPIGGSVILAGAVYVATSLFITGPLVAKRTIDLKSNWNAICERNLKAEISERRSPPKIIPRTDCQSILGQFMPELGQLCRQYGNPDFGGYSTQLLRQQERLRQQAEERRLAKLATQSGSRCECAASAVSQNKDWALTAGSLRLVSPPSTNVNLKSELTHALNSPRCSEVR
jgi:hypothetical protein